MKKLLAVGVMVLFIGMTISSSTGLYVEKQSIKPLSSGNTLYVGGNGTGNYTTIQAAIDDADDGDTVFVYNGTYFENIIVDKSITLMGEDKNTTIIDGGNWRVVYISTDWVNISGFTIQNGGTGIRLSRCNGYTLSNNIITSNFFGIVSTYCSDNTISENIVSNNENGATSLQDLEDSTISGNIVTNNGGSGISISSRSYSNLISDNIVVGNGNGIDLSEASNNIVSSNTITSNSVDGIYLQFSSGNTISENDIEDTDYYGILVGLSSDNNTLYHNNFKNNNQNAKDGCNNTWDNGYPSCGNYWDDYNGIDSDGDGIGDTPYNISGGDNQDRYPLMQPYHLITYVDDNFNSSTSGWGFDHFDKIQDGIDAVARNGTVYVYNGIYYENVEVDKSINLIGEDKDTTVIDGSRKDDVVSVSADNINMSGFTISNSGIGDAGIDISSTYNTIMGNKISDNSDGMRFGDSSNNTITGNNIISNICDGICLLSFSNYNTITGNNISNKWDDGIYLYKSNRNNISGNNISNNHRGIQLDGYSNHNTITGNNISNNYVGIRGSPWQSNSYNTIIDNTISNNMVGIQLEGSSTYNTITGNTICSNDVTGIFLNGSSNILSSNTISNNDYGICLDYYSNNNVTSNTISNNDYGIYMYSSSSNTILKNNFLDNERDAFFITSFLNQWKQNYWNESRVLPKFIFGLIKIGSIWIPWINIDWHPAQEPYDIEV